MAGGEYGEHVLVGGGFLVERQRIGAGGGGHSPETEVPFSGTTCSMICVALFIIKASSK